MDYEWITYNARDCGNGNIHITFAHGTLSHKKVGEFWLPYSIRNLTWEKQSEILKKRIREVMGWDRKGTPIKIHLAYFTGEIK